MYNLIKTRSWISKQLYWRICKLYTARAIRTSSSTAQRSNGEIWMPQEEMPWTNYRFINDLSGNKGGNNVASLCEKVKIVICSRCFSLTWCTETRLAKHGIDQGIRGMQGILFSLDSRPAALGPVLRVRSTREGYSVFVTQWKTKKNTKVEWNAW